MCKMWPPGAVKRMKCRREERGMQQDGRKGCVLDHSSLLSLLMLLIRKMEHSYTYVEWQ